MTRYKLTIEYDGGPFVGWQRQDNGLSVQQVLEEAVFGFCGETVTVQGAGRTDSGVHALGQVAHVDIAKPRDPQTVRDALNAHLRPNRIVVIAAQVVAEDFHARFSATRRRYLYRIVNRRSPLALEQGRAWFVPQPLDVEAMHAAAQQLLGQHDFSSFRAKECQAESPVKTLDRLDVARRGETVEIAAAARSFLHHQVRNFAGSLKFVGTGKWPPEKLAEVLAARDRAVAGPTAPPDGLYLVAVDYD